jgi:hypothetical protein
MLRKSSRLKQTYQAFKIVVSSTLPVFGAFCAKDPAAFRHEADLSARSPRIVADLLSAVLARRFNRASATWLVDLTLQTRYRKAHRLHDAIAAKRTTLSHWCLGRAPRSQPLTNP